MKKGGLGVSSFFATNRALLFKWVWQFVTHGSSLWFIKAIYGEKGALDKGITTTRRSPWIDIICELCSFKSKGIDILAFFRKKVGNGENSMFWDDVWLGYATLKVQYPRLYALELCKDIVVAEKMRDPTLVHTYCHPPRGGAEDEQNWHLLSRIADVFPPSNSKSMGLVI